MEYRRKAKYVDQDLLGVATEEKGPVERRLDEFGNLVGLCFGAWGEASTDVHKLIQTLAEARLKFLGLKEGKPRSKHEMGLIVGQLRQRLSLAAVKSQVDCLLSRIHQIGPGNKQLAKKREWAVIEDKRMKRESTAQWLLQYEGTQTLRKGFIKTA